MEFEFIRAFLGGLLLGILFTVIFYKIKVEIMVRNFALHVVKKYEEDIRTALDKLTADEDGIPIEKEEEEFL